MNRREKKRVNREIAAIASLKDSEIDTSDIPEISDWSGAIVGKFYGPQARALRFDDTKPKPEPLVRTERSVTVDSHVTEGHAAVLVEHLSTEQLITECVSGTAKAWDEFIRRSHPLIASVVVRTARLRGQTSPEVIEDLTQDVYVKLFADNHALLKKLKSPQANTFAGYLKAVTANLVMDYFRAEFTAKRGASEPDPAFSNAIHSPSKENEVSVFFNKVDEILRNRASARDRDIFWLYYQDGLTTKEIASTPGFDLTVKVVESIVWRLTKLLKLKMSSNVDKRLFRNH